MDFNELDGVVGALDNGAVYLSNIQQSFGEKGVYCLNFLKDFNFVKEKAPGVYVFTNSGRKLADL